MNRLVFPLGVALFLVSHVVTGQQNTRPQNDKYDEWIERLRAVEVSISAGGGIYGPVKESFQAGEPVTIVVWMTNKGAEATGVMIADPYFQNRPKLTKDGREIPYRHEVAEVLKRGRREGCGGGGRVLTEELEPNEKQLVDSLLIHKGAGEIANIVWYDTLEPGRYEISIRRRLSCGAEPEAESDTIEFEVAPSGR
jgi:hypothetical protein